MVKDAEAHAEDDRKFRELVDTRNKADALMHGTEKTLKELGDKVPGAERATIESAMSDLKTALGGDDKDIIDRKAQALAQAAQSLGQFAQAGADAGAQGAQQASSSGGSAGGKDDVLDAEFEEVKDKKKS